ncbi:16S rRNA (uracil(1498)-N(3))-methyltransferase [Candidatus Dojkabacteria bacterium]|uniref:Ribosomal RNA small subunit methyltransferase E n=1 Tax=Candidatus Dojkabacteria bacterium TaxID=2099670 RepID=A0A955L4V8_9BACT|nr:16S rRNA (uracil(1498)-N(3))-methyltransferase [Candidatus Dojkabacteria bacterium]
MHRFFIDPENISGEYFQILDTKVIKYMRSILRLNSGDQIALFDGSGFEYVAEINKITKTLVTGKISEEREIVEDWPKLMLAQALPKGNKLDDIVRMNTEIGVHEFRLFSSEYSVVKLADFRDKKLERLGRLITDASRQSERAHIPSLYAPVELSEIFQIEADMKLILHSRETTNTEDIKAIKDKLNIETSILVVIGPEGGFSEREVNLAIDNGFIAVNLKLPILRTETAGVAVSSILLS